MTSTPDPVRAAFQAQCLALAVKNYGYSQGDALLKSVLERRGDGRYVVDWVEGAWNGWQAAKEPQPKPDSMLLLTTHQKVSCEERNNIAPLERNVAFATALPLCEALARIKNYEAAYKKKSMLDVEYRLLSVADIEAQVPELLESFGVLIVERLMQSPEDFDREELRVAARAPHTSAPGAHAEP
ncbi:hypothetical protein [Pseudomonas sp. MPR-ANC1]|uniref:hypothetical protein n=1 Tax=Pseudomonas sp. MPR-ANC1 TaxID=2075548 RepID=UPI0011AF4762|nr:hypothetical protein [Pseudomonas sp. MPR-ANC1]